jgi:hypothetical protein
MMISFLAALRNGVAFEDTAIRRDTLTTTRDRSLGAKVRLPALGSLLGFDASGRMGRNEQEQASEEIQAIRQHTAASLFNALYDALIDGELLKYVGRAADLPEMSTGDVVEISGDFVGNPLEPVVAFFKQALPYFDMAEEGEAPPSIDIEAVQAEAAIASAQADDLKARAAKAERSGNPAMQAQALAFRQQAHAAQTHATAQQMSVDARLEHRNQMLGIKMINQVGEDLATTPVQDTVIIADDFKAVLTMSAEFFTDTTRAHLRAGAFRAVGKVTRVLDPGHEVNLLRRTVLGAAGAEFGRGLLRSVVEDGSLQIETFDPIIAAPAIQVLPLAVFV